MSSQLFTAALEHDGQTEELRTPQVAVGNGRLYGGGMTVHADATATDGNARLLQPGRRSLVETAGTASKPPKGTQGEWKDVRAFSTTGLTLRTSKPHAVSLDGEIKTMTPVTFRIREKTISRLRL
jgi:diacylglycerol kinase (ATP)